MKERIYVSGQMTGIKNFNEKQFNKIEFYLTQKGFIVVSPIKLAYKLMKIEGRSLQDISRGKYLRYDIRHLLACDCIYMMKDWIKSEGAKLEFIIATAIGLQIYYE